MSDDESAASPIYGARNAAGIVTSDVIREQLDNTKHLESFEHFLKGEVSQITKNADGDEVITWQKTYKALIREEEIGIVMSTIENMTSKTILLTRLTDDDINKSCLNICDTFVDWLEDYDYRYSNIDGGAGTDIVRSNYPLIMANLRLMVRSSLNRARNGLTHEGITKGVQRVEQNIHHESQNSQTGSSGFGIPKLWGKGG